MDKKLIKEATDALELLDIYIYSSKVERYTDIDFDNYPEEMVQQDKLGVDGEFFDVEESNDEIVRAKVKLGSRFILPKGDEFDSLAEIEASFIAEYKIHKKISEDAMSEFMNFNAVHNVWPFWREFAFRSANDSRLPKPMVPLMRGIKK